MKNPLRAIAGAALLVAAWASSPAHADICDQYGSAIVAGQDASHYIVQNNRWNNNVPGEQCIKVIDQIGAQGPGFTIAKQTGTAPTNGAPVSYPSIYLGCHYNNCSPGTNLPMQVEAIKTANTNISLKYTGGAIFDASYDIWLDPRPIKDGKNAREVMIWLNRRGDIQPIGSNVGNAKIAKLAGVVWPKRHNRRHLIRRAVYHLEHDFNVLDFIASVRDFAARFPECGKKIDGFYLTSIQAGFEPWKGGVGLAIERFQASVDAKQPDGR